MADKPVVLPMIAAELLTVIVPVPVDADTPVDPLLCTLPTLVTLTLPAPVEAAVIATPFVEVTDEPGVTVTVPPALLAMIVSDVEVTASAPITLTALAPEETALIAVVEPLTMPVLSTSIVPAVVALMPMDDSDRTVALPPVAMFPVRLVAWMPSPEPVIVPLLLVILIAPLPPVLAEMPLALSPVVIVTVPVAEVFEALIPSDPPMAAVAAT